MLENICNINLRRCWRVHLGEWPYGCREYEKFFLSVTYILIREFTQGNGLMLAVNVENPLPVTVAVIVLSSQ